jgi:phosphomannomutase/phosphoglucomutase
MNKQIFREYDIRGVVGSDFTMGEVANLAQAIVSYFLSQDSTISTIVIGRDGRTHSRAIFDEVVTTLTNCGINVIDIGLCPTPVFYFSLHSAATHSGFIITASHNPGEYNGFKICLNKRSVYGQAIQEIYSIFTKGTFLTKPSQTKGTITQYDANAAYIAWMSNHFAHLKGLELPFVIDCGNGAAGATIPTLVKSMNWKNARLLFEEVDGTFPNHEADPTKTENMGAAIQTITHNNLSLGIGLDGDCDRMCPITQDGSLVNGDIVLALYSKQVLENNPGAPVVYDIKSSSGLSELLEAWGAQGRISPTGHSLIKSSMEKYKALLAGEMSCHFFFKDRYFGYDDGIYAMMRLLEIMHTHKKSLKELITIFPEKVSSPEYRIACKEEDKTPLVEHVRAHFLAQKNKEVITIDGIRVHKDYGWGLLRASNTQPVVCLRFEAASREDLSKIKNDFLACLSGRLDEGALKKVNA